MRRYENIIHLVFAVLFIFLVTVVIYSEALNSMPSENRLNLFGWKVFLPFTRENVNCFLAWTAAGGGLIVFASSWDRVRTILPTKIVFFCLTSLVVIATTVAVLQYTVIRDRYFDAGDTFAYYLVPKYFNELEYDNLYVCTVVAHEELGDWMPKSIRDLGTNHILPVSSLSKQQKDSCRSRFTPRRWESFRRDVELYSNWIPRGFYEQVLIDHGYNGTPVWQSFAGPIANWVPITHRNMVFISLLNLPVIFLMFGFVIHAFGWKMGLIFPLLFWTNLLERYLLGGAYFRYDWIACLVIGMCLMKNRKYAASGVLISLASGLKIFPVLFLAGPIYLVVLHWIKFRRLHTEYLRFFAGALAGILVFGIVSVCHGHGLDNWSGFLHQMSLNAGRLSIHRVGFIYNFFWPKEIFLGDPAVGYAVSAMKKPFLLFISVDGIRWALVAAFLIALMRAARRMDEVGVTALFGFSLFFLFFSTVRYYYAGFVGLPLMWHQSVNQKQGALFLSFLLFGAAAAYLAEQHLAYCFVYNTYHPMLFTLYLIAVLVFYNRRNSLKTA
jgi:hypothetical protein